MELVVTCNSAETYFRLTPGENGFGGPVLPSPSLADEGWDWVVLALRVRENGMARNRRGYIYTTPDSP